jgi:hypothetical protein
MSDERLIRALRALDRPVDVDPAFGDSLYSILEGEYARRHQIRPRVTLLLVAALLVALVVGGAVAVGSGLLRLPAPDAWIIGPYPSDDGCFLAAPPAETRITEIATQGAPGTVAFAACSFWVGSWTTNAVQRIDPSTNEITATITVGRPGSTVRDLATDGEDVWASIGLSLVRIDPLNNVVVEQIEIPETMGDMMVVVGGRAWLSGFEFPRPGAIDLTSGEVVHEIPGSGFVDAGFGSVWANAAGAILRIDPRTFEVTRLDLPHPDAYLTAVSATGLWVASPQERRIYKLSPIGDVLLTLDEERTVDSERVTAVRAVLGRHVYATSTIYVGGSGDPDRTEILRIDDLTDEIVERLVYSAEAWSEAVEAAGDSIWVGNTEIPTLVRYEFPGSP